MTSDDENKLLETLYDRLFDALTYAPDGQASAWNRNTTFLQFAKNLVIDPRDFEGMMNPGNPKGDLTKAELFSAFVDAQPSLSPLWADSGFKLSDTYSSIVNNANTDSQVLESQKDLYNKANDYLFETVTTQGFDSEYTTVTPTNVSAAYDEAQKQYTLAVVAFRNGYNKHDLTTSEGQLAWNADAPALQLAVDQAWNNWIRSYKAPVEQAQNALVSSVNDAISSVIAESQKLVTGLYLLPSNSPGGRSWLPSYALPTEWYGSDIEGSQFSLSSSFLNEKSSSSATKYSAEASGSRGFFHASGGVSGDREEQTASLQANSFELEAELITVTIKRPWLNPLLFTMNDWWVGSTNAGGISNANINDIQGKMPLLPTGFVLARNVKIKANFTSEDKKFISDSISTKASGGWGPFSFSGSYSKSSTKESFEATFEDGVLKLPGLQVIAWVNSVIPYSPPQNPKGISAVEVSSNTPNDPSRNN